MDLNKRREKLKEMYMALFDPDDDKYYLLAKELNVNPYPLTVEQVRALTSPLQTSHNSKFYTPLELAMLFNDVEMCKYLIEEEKTDVNCATFSGFGHLSTALNEGRYEIAKILIKSGAKVNEVDKEGKTPMYYAIIKDSPVHIVKDIIEAGFSKDGIICKDGNITPLVQAIRFENLPVVKYLLEQSVNVNVIALEGYTPLTISIDLNSKEITQLLMENGANVEGLFRNDLPPLFRELTYSEVDIDILMILLRAGVNVNRVFTPCKYMKNEISKVTYVTAFELAVSTLDIRVIKLFLQYGADINVKSPISHNTILHSLLNMDLVYLPDRLTKPKLRTIVRFLLENGADLNARNKSGLLPIDCALLSKNWTALEEYCKTARRQESPSDTTTGGKPMLDSRQEPGRPPHHYSFLDFFKEVCGTPNEQDKNRIFSLAIKEKKVDLMELCLAYGVDPHGYEGVHTLDSFYITALFTNKPEIVKVFLKFKYPFDGFNGQIDYDANTSLTSLLKNQFMLFEGIRLQDPDAVKAALKNGAVANGCSSAISHPLHYCAGLEKDSRASTAIVKLLLEYGASPAGIYEGMTPLYIASLNGRLEMCKAFLRHGARLEFGCLSELSLNIREGSDLGGVKRLLTRALHFFTMLKRKDMRVIDELEKMIGTENCCIYMNCVNSRGNTLLGEAVRLNLRDFAAKLMAIRLKMK